MTDITLTVVNPSGLHARPAAVFVKAAAGFDSNVRVTNVTRDPERSVAANSMLGVLSLGVSAGHQIRISAEGDEADAALAALRELVESGLGEDIPPDAAT